MSIRLKKEVPFDKSFASTPYANLWSKINTLRADEVNGPPSIIYLNALIVNIIMIHKYAMPR